MGDNYLPRSDNGLLNWATAFTTYLAAHSGEVGLTDPEAAALAVQVDAARAALANHFVQQEAAQAACAAKEEQLQRLEKTVRSYVRRLQAHPTVTASQREAMGLPVHDTIRTAVAPPATRPMGLVKAHQRLRHEIGFIDAGTPTRKAKPKGVQGCEIWVKIAAGGEGEEGGEGGSGPVNAAELTFRATATASPYVLDFKGSDGGKTAWYQLRWVNTKGQVGPWSQPVSATILG